jgi:small subunit ribosomal protein S2e
LLQIKPVQKQTRAGQRTRFKAIVIIGDSEGHVGLGIKTSKEVATAIRAAIIIAKLSVLPIRRGYWGTSLGEPHSLPCKQSGKCGSVTVRVCFYISYHYISTKIYGNFLSFISFWFFFPPFFCYYGFWPDDGVCVIKKKFGPSSLTFFFSVGQLIPAPRGTGLVASPSVTRLLQLAGVADVYTSSSGSTKTQENTLKATFAAVGNTYGFLTPNLWKETKLVRSPLEEYGDVLREAKRY